MIGDRAKFINMDKQTKKNIGEIIWGQHVRWGHAFDYVMIGIILFSVALMAIETLPNFPEQYRLLSQVVNWFVIIIFTIEYGLRYWTCPKKINYVFSFWGLIDLAAILPFWLSLVIGLPSAETLLSLRILRVAKLLRFIANMEVLQRGFELMWRELLVVLSLAIIMMFCTAFGIHAFENAVQPDVFSSIPHSFWFAVTSLTTVGYGDMYPITAGGKFFTFIVLMIGLGVVAMPAGIVSAALTQAREELNEQKAAKKKKKK
ncbi:MAG: ion transporter [Nitratireductor sp.]